MWRGTGAGWSRVANGRSPRRVGARTRLLAALASLLAVFLLTPAVSSAQAGVTVLRDIPYAPPSPPGSRGHLLDLYLPEGVEGPMPVVIWSTGSAWFSDNGKAGAAPAADQFTPLGYAVAGVSVRSSSQANFPAQLYDGKAAVRWLREHALEYNLDPRRFAIIGNSSGGWLASIVGTTGGVRELRGDVGFSPSSFRFSDRVQAVVDLYGPTDFLQMNSGCEMDPLCVGLIDHDAPDSPESRLVGCPIQTCPEKAQRANPIAYVTADDPPFMVMHGQNDGLVPHHQSVLLYEALRDGCNDVEFFSVPGYGHTHAYLDDELLSPGRTVFSSRDCQGERVRSGPAPTWEEIDRFFVRTLTEDRPGRRP
jgi:acetyl esterase/lipase